MKKGNVEVFFGDEPKDQTEQKFLRRLRADLNRRDIPALILVNLELGRPRLQLDFVIATGQRTVQCELKGYVHPVSGGENGRWEQRLPDGERRQLGNPGRQAKDATYALSDSLRDFASKSKVPPATEAEFSRHIDTVLCFYPELPAGSDVRLPRFVKPRQYGDLLTSLTEEGPRVPWTREHWHEFIHDCGLFQIEEHPELDRRSRAEQYLSTDYCRQFITGRGLELSDQVPTGARVDGEDVETVELAARLLRGEAIVLNGASGVGKTLMSDHAAVELARSGELPIWLDAAAFAGDFDALLGRSVAPFTMFPARELIQVASAAGRRVALIVDGLNECAPDLRSGLLHQVGSLRLAYQAGVVISTVSPPGGLPESLDGHHVELLRPDRAEKESILRSYDAVELLPHSDAFATPFELKIAAECVGEAGEHPTRASVLDAYVGRLSGSESVRAMLREIAWQMHSGLRGTLRVREIVRRLERDGVVSVEAVDEALACKLLRVGTGLVSFVHESFVQFLAAEAIVIDAADTETLNIAIAQPSNEELRSDVLALESEERLVETLATLTDEEVLVAAIVGDLGEHCRAAVEQVIAELFERARSITDEAVAGERDWELTREWSRAEAALLSAVGRAIHRGHLLPGTIELFEQTDARCVRLLEERGGLTDAQAVSEMVAATYALPYVSSSRWLPATVILRAMEHDFTGRLRESPSSGIPAQLLVRAGVQSWGLLLLAAAAARRFSPGDHEILPELLSKGWAAGAYHLHLAVLNISHDAAWSIKGPAREHMKQTIERIDTSSLFVGSSLLEVLDAYEMVDGRPLEDVEREIATSLKLAEDDELAGQTARGIISSQFEPEGIVGPYHEAILALDDAERAKLYRRAIKGSAADDLSADVAVRELAELGDLSDPQVQEAFAGLLRSPGNEKWHSVQWGMRSCLAANDACARFATEPVLPAEELAGLEGWRFVFSLLFWQERERVEGADYLSHQRELLGELRVPVVRAGVPAVLYVMHISDRMMDSDELSAHDRLLKRFSEELRELFHWSLMHEEELTSCFRHYGSAEISPYVVDMLGMIGDESSVELLRARANDSSLGSRARGAVRGIEQRAGASVHVGE